MASASTKLGDIEERFFECSLCLESLEDPKALPCLHRYCKKCIRKVIDKKEDKFNCPLCNEECDLPADGAEGLKTDFLVKSILEFLQLQDTFKKDNVRRCRGCKETKEVNSYCFKCRGFLCQHCYQFHLDNDMVEDHRPHLLDLQTVDVRSLTLEKLSSLTEDPRCAVHIKHMAQMCCETCGNLPTCVACCAFGKHKGHVTHEVQILAKSEGENLTAVMTGLEECKDHLYELPKRVAIVREELAANVKEGMEKARSRYEEASERILKEAVEEKGVLQKQRKEILRRKKEDCKRILEEEMKKMKEKYTNILKEREQHHDGEVKDVDKMTSLVDEKSSVEVEKLQQKLRGYEEEVKAVQENNEKRIMGVADHARHTINRYENFTATAKTVQASHDEWTEAQCLPGITAAGEALIVDARKEFGDLESLSKTGIRDSLLFGNTEGITESHDSVVDIMGIGEEWRVDGITSSGDGNVIVTGLAQGAKSHITVINREGGVVRQDQIEMVAGSQNVPYRYCHSLSEHLTATACRSNQVGLYDNRNGEYVEKDIGDINANWPGYVTNVATDTLKNIYVGGNMGEVLVLDEQLNYLRIIKLPEIIEYVVDLAVHGNHLIVCDYHARRSCAVTMQGEAAVVAYELTGPDGEDWRPLGVCTDSTNHIYMLWAGSGEEIITQYSQDGGQLLATRQVDGNAYRISTVVREEGEKLLVVTVSSRKLYTFGLLKEWGQDGQDPEWTQI